MVLQSGCLILRISDSMLFVVLVLLVVFVLLVLLVILVLRAIQTLQESTQTVAMTGAPS